MTERVVGDAKRAVGSVIFGLHDEPVEVTMSRFRREVLDKLYLKMVARQLGEAFSDLDRRHVLTITRGPARRETA